MGVEDYARLRTGNESGPPLNRDRIERELAGFAPVAQLRIGEHEQLDEFIARKGIIPRMALEAMDARVSTRRGDAVIAFPFAAGIKFRRMDTGRRWSRGQFRDHPLNIIFGRDALRGEELSDRAVFVAEGETDAAALVGLYPESDVAVMPVGAFYWSEIWTAQLSGYRIVYGATDNDEAGEAAHRGIRDAVLNGESARLPVARHAPPEGFKDWCDYAATGAEPREPAAEPDERVTRLGPVNLELALPRRRRRR